MHAVHHRSSLRSAASAPRSETKGSNLKATLVSNAGPVLGLRGGLLVDGVKELHVRLCDLAGESVVLENIEKLSFDANNVRCKRFEVRHERAGRLPKAKFEGNDFRGEQLIFVAPSKMKGSNEHVTLKSCWFGGLEDSDAIRAALIRDAESEIDSGVIVKLKKISPRPLGLGGPLE